MVRVEKKHPKNLKGSKVSRAQKSWLRYNIGLTRGQEPDEKTQLILWTERPTGALVGAGSVWSQMPTKLLACVAKLRSVGSRAPVRGLSVMEVWHSRLACTSSSNCNCHASFFSTWHGNQSITNNKFPQTLKCFCSTFLAFNTYPLCGLTSPFPSELELILMSPTETHGRKGVLHVHERRLHPTYIIVVVVVVYISSYDTCLSNN